LSTLIKAYYLLTKPGIIYSNVFTAIGGFFLAERGYFTPGLFLAMVFGLAFIIASACVFNNYIDRGIDSKMLRTKKRALVTRQISGRNALIFASILGLAGFGLLIAYTNILTSFIAFVGFFFYIVLYGIWKRRSTYGTIVGSISGAVPPVVGYCAVTNQIDLAAILLFLILVFWQMPHFYAIAMFRSDDYAAASIPVLPIKKGMYHTKIQNLFYISAFILASLSLTVFHYTGITYFVLMAVCGLVWFAIALQSLHAKEDKRMARKMFFFSLIIIVVFSLLLIFNYFLL